LVVNTHLDRLDSLSQRGLLLVRETESRNESMKKEIEYLKESVGVEKNDMHALTNSVRCIRLRLSFLLLLAF
jgi:hypothetical protein